MVRFLRERLVPRPGLFIICYYLLSIYHLAYAGRLRHRLRAAVGIRQRGNEDGEDDNGQYTHRGIGDIGRYHGQPEMKNDGTEGNNAWYAGNFNPAHPGSPNNPHTSFGGSDSTSQYWADSPYWQSKFPVFPVMPRASSFVANLSLLVIYCPFFQSFQIILGRCSLH